MSDSTCPDAVALEALASDDASVTAELRTHVTTCADCSRTLDEIRRNNALGAEVADLDGPSAGGGAPTIEGYAIEAELRRGGQGVVFRGRQLATNRPVAIKVLLDGAFATPAQRRRFEREAELVARLRHPNVVTVYDSGRTADGRHYLAMELVDGTRLDAYAREHLAHDVPGRLRLFVAIARAVGAAHQRGVMHRDLKPGNVLVDADGQPRVLDFGLARADDERDAVTLTGDFVGTLAYAAPEQLESGGADVDARADVYALGVILYELLADRPPHAMDGALADVVRAITTTDPPPPSRVAAHVDRALDSIVAMALEKDPARRYQSASELAADVERHLRHETILAHPATPAEQLRKFARRHRVLVAATAAIALALALGIASTTWQALEARRALRDVERVAAFQSSMLAGIRPDDVGWSVVDDLARRVEASLEARGAEDAAVEAGHFRTLLAEINHADVGRALFTEHVLAPAERRIDADFADQPLVAARLEHTLGEVYHALGADADAERTLRRVLDTRRAELGADDLETLKAANDLALVLAERSDLDAAAPLYEATLDRLVATRGPDDRQALITASNLARLRELQGRIDEAESLYRRTLERQRRVLGPGDRATLGTMNNLAVLYQGQGRTEDAERLIRAALAQQRATLGDDHPDTLNSLNNLAHFLANQGRFDEAEPLCREAMDAHLRVYGEQHPATLRCLTSFVALLHGRQRYAEAEPVQERLVESARGVLGPEHPLTLSSMNMLAILYAQQGRHDEAEPLYRAALEVQQRLFGEASPSALQTMTNLTDGYRLQGDCAKAISRYRELLALYERTGMQRTVGAGVTLRGLGMCLTADEQYDEAERRLLDANTIFEATLAPAHPLRRLVLEAIVALYEAWEREDDAAQWRERLAALNR